MTKTRRVGLPECPLCGSPIPWWRRWLRVHLDFFYGEDSECPSCRRGYALLIENGPGARYHRACLLEALEKAGGGPHG